MGLFTGLSRRDLDRAISQVEQRVNKRAEDLFARKGAFDNLTKVVYSMADKVGLEWSPEKKDWVKKGVNPNCPIHGDRPAGIPLGATKVLEVAIEGQGNGEDVVRAIMEAVKKATGGAEEVPVKRGAGRPAKNGKKVK